jgi:hypothetical protein
MCYNKKENIFHIRLLAELLLNGVAPPDSKEGIQLLGNAIVFLTTTDRLEFTNVAVLLPFCRTLLFDVAGVVPQLAGTCITPEEREKLFFPADGLHPFSQDQRAAIATVLGDHFNALVDRLKQVFTNDYSFEFQYFRAFMIILAAF